MAARDKEYPSRLAKPPDRACSTGNPGLELWEEGTQPKDFRLSNPHRCASNIAVSRPRPGETLALRVCLCDASLDSHKNECRIVKAIEYTTVRLNLEQNQLVRVACCI